jgi:hypothetical protein
MIGKAVRAGMRIGIVLAAASGGLRFGRRVR